jgi:hypothetical protein
MIFLAENAGTLFPCVYAVQGTGHGAVFFLHWTYKDSLSDLYHGLPKPKATATDPNLRQTTIDCQETLLSLRIQPTIIPSAVPPLTKLNMLLNDERPPLQERRAGADEVGHCPGTLTCPRPEPKLSISKVVLQHHA